MFLIKFLYQRSILLILACIVIGACSYCTRNHSKHTEAEKSLSNLIDTMPYIEFTHLIMDAGKISSGEKVGMDFVFHNKGQKNLFILDSKAACGCTVANWDKKPIPPGERGIIRIIYDSNGELGMQNKSIHIISNARNKETDLIISAEVIN